jgi:hypothetical protein
VYNSSEGDERLRGGMMKKWVYRVYPDEEEVRRVQSSCQNSRAERIM